MRNTLIEARGKKTQMYASSEIGISQKMDTLTFQALYPCFYNVDLLNYFP